MDSSGFIEVCDVVDLSAPLGRGRRTGLPFLTGVVGMVVRLALEERERLLECGTSLPSQAKKKGNPFDESQCFERNCE